MSMWYLRGSTLVSSCRCVVGVPAVQPVAMRKAAFCVTCSFCRWVFAKSGCQDVCA